MSADSVPGARLRDSEVDRIIDINSADEFYKLRDTPGFCLEATSWATACQLVEEGTVNSLGQLGRHPRDIVTYRQFRRQVCSPHSTGKLC